MLLNMDDVIANIYNKEITFHIPTYYATQDSCLLINVIFNVTQHVDKTNCSM